MSEQSGPLIRVVQAQENPECRRVWLWCPGCNEACLIAIPLPDGTHTSAGPVWEWDGNETAPTFAPSLLTRTGDNSVCHSFIRAGRWEFLPDSTHELAGRTVPMVPLPDWMVDAMGAEE